MTKQIDDGAFTFEPCIVVRRRSGQCDVKHPLAVATDHDRDRKIVLERHVSHCRAE
jgi:hypothetical protein